MKLRDGVFAVLIALVSWPEARAQADPTTLDYRLAARAVAPGVWVVEGANADFAPANGCNIINTAFLATGAGVVVVNTGPSRRYGEQLRALIARTTAEPVVQVLHSNLHPDHFFGNQAFADVPRAATARTRDGIAREVKAYEDNLYRLCGEWLQGTEALPPDADVAPGLLRIGTREFELREFDGHTASDLVIVERTSGTVFAGGLAFAQRLPTTPHAAPATWLASLDRLAAQLEREGPAALVPSHGPVRRDVQALVQTRRYLAWLDATLRAAAERGRDATELRHDDVPPEFRAWAAFPAEYTRSVAHLYPRYERAALGAPR